MKRHAPIGADILAVIGFPYAVAPIVRHHHENWDGTGYPDGLAGGQIPIGSRIIAVVDCFDALTSDRPYRPDGGSGRAPDHQRSARQHVRPAGCRRVLRASRDRDDHGAVAARSAGRRGDAHRIDAAAAASNRSRNAAKTSIFRRSSTWVERWAHRRRPRNSARFCGRISERVSPLTPSCSTATTRRLTRIRRDLYGG